MYFDFTEYLHFVYLHENYDIKISNILSMFFLRYVIVNCTTLYNCRHVAIDHWLSYASCQLSCLHEPNVDLLQANVWLPNG